MKTEFLDTAAIERKWVIIDAKDVVLGRLASKVVPILMGKNKKNWAPNQDHGDNVIIVNADQIHLTGTKRETMRYFNHSTHPGGWRELSVAQASAITPGFPVWHAIKRMVPKTILGDHMLKKLHIYGGEAHPHAAQKPVAVAVK